MINKVTLIGNAGADAESKILDNGTTVCRLSLATNESWKDKAGEWQTQTEWHNITAFRETAERLATVRKGQLVYVDGKITYRKYTDKEGSERYATDISCNTFRILEKKEGGADHRFPTDEPGRNGANENQTGGNGLPDVASLPNLRPSQMGPETLAANPPDDLPF